MNLLEMQHVKRTSAKTSFKRYQFKRCRGRGCLHHRTFWFRKIHPAAMCDTVEQMDDGSLTYMGEKAAESINGKRYANRQI